MEKQKLISVKEFSPEELRKWQMKLLEILVYFRDFCDSHNLRFYLAGGTSIGAVRHHGFIPWDDDIDVQMPRDDYEKLLKIWDKEADTSRFVCEYPTKKKCTGFPMAVIRSVNTTCIYEHSVDLDICQGLKIDVEFLDGVPNNALSRKINMLAASMLALFRAQRVPNQKPPVIRLLSRILLGIFPTRSLRWHIAHLCEKRISHWKFGESTNVRYLQWGVMPSRCYNKTKYVDFEGYKMPIPEGYHEILTADYGDYMQFPPEDKRVPLTHNLVFYDLDHSYLNYKGKYYCVTD